MSGAPLLSLPLAVDEITDGDGAPVHYEASISWPSLYDSPDIRINAPDAVLVAQRIVDLWNAALAIPPAERGCDA